MPEEPKTPPEQKPGIAPREGSDNEASDGLPKTWEEVFAHPRFKELLGRAKTAEDKLAKLEVEKDAASKADAEKRHEFEKLYREAEKQNAALQAQIGELTAAGIKRIKREALVRAALAHNPPFSTKAADDAHLFVDLDKIAVDGDVVAGADALIAALAVERPYMLAQGRREDPGAPKTGTQATGMSIEEKRAIAYHPRL